MTPPRIHFLGTGTAFNTDGRASQCLLVEPRDLAPFLVDAGPTTAQQLERARIDSARLDRLFLTHLHGDHVAGWPFLLLHFVFLHRRTRPFEICGPPGTRATLERLAGCCFAELEEHRRFELRWREIDVREEREVVFSDGPRLDVLPMEHHPSSIGLRFRIDGRSLSVSGDTRWCDNLERLARDSDRLLMECSTVDGTVGAHVSLRELRDGRQRLGCADIVLLHLTDAVAADLARDPLPGVLASYDGLVLPL